MKFCVFDTEGNGLFRYKDDSGKPVPADDPSQPRLAALGMILLNADLTVSERYQALVKRDGWSMTAESTAVNGITDEILDAKGIPVATVLDVYQQAIREGFAMVAFNAQHDLKQMRAEFRRAGRPDLFMETKNVCVMRKARGVIPRLDGKNNWPSLHDCREFLKLSHDAKHTAGADAESALAVFLHLHGAGVDLTPEVHFANQGGKPARKGGGTNATASAASAASRAGGAGGSGENVTAESEIPE